MVHTCCMLTYRPYKTDQRVPGGDWPDARRVCACAARPLLRPTVVLYPSDKTWEGKGRQRQGGGGAKGVLAADGQKSCSSSSSTRRPIRCKPCTVCQCALSQPQTNSWIDHSFSAWRGAFAALGVAPERDASQGATEPPRALRSPRWGLGRHRCRRQRPTDAAQQKAQDSGKKKTHTDKNLLLVNEHTTKVIYLGPTVAGKTHDKQAADGAQMGSPTNATLGEGHGFPGL